MESLEITRERLTDIFEKLDSMPAEKFDNTPARLNALLEMDNILHNARSENHPLVGEFYRKRCEKALREIADYKGEVPRLWKFYSSGIIVKSGNDIFAYDLNIGSESFSFRCRLNMGDELLKEFAKLITAYFSTHEHSDHFNPLLADELLSQDKPVFVTANAVKFWCLPESCNVEKNTFPGMHPFHSFQLPSSGARGPGVGCPDTAFLQELPTGNLFVKGDIFTDMEILDTVGHYDKLGLSIDFAPMSSYHIQPTSMTDELLKRNCSLFIPVHEWEFCHRPYGKEGMATQSYGFLAGEFGEAAKLGKRRLISWGESIPLVK